LKTLLRNCRIVDGTGAPALEAAAVWIDGDRIAWRGREADAPPASPPDRVVDAGGRTVLPGLFNVHVHLGLKLPFPEKRADPFTHGYRTLLNYRRAMEAIATGTTAIRVIGEPAFTDIDVREAIERGLLPGPRLRCAGHALIATGGHGHNSIGCREADGPDEFRRAAREQLRAGADYLKICLTGGIGTPRERADQKQMSDEEVAAVVEVARARDTYVASHTGGNGPVKDAVRLGVGCIEHGYFFDDEAARMMADAGTYLCPTLCVTQELDYMRRHGVQEWMLSKAKAAAEAHLASARRAAEWGVRFVCGTDLLPSDPVDGTVATIREIEWMGEAGLSPLQAVQAATLNSASVCGFAAETGSVEAGKAADLLVVDGRPDARLRDLRDVRLVMKGGAVFRSEIAGLDDPGLSTANVALRDGTFARLW
jgi:imidazolonepropionase-like amidohydrolase